MTLETIEANALILFERMKEKNTDPSLMTIILSTYIGSCGVIEDIDILSLTSKFLHMNEDYRREFKMPLGESMKNVIKYLKHKYQGRYDYRGSFYKD